MYSDESMLLRAAAADSTRRNASNSYTRHFSPLLREKKNCWFIFLNLQDVPRKLFLNAYYSEYLSKILWVLTACHLPFKGMMIKILECQGFFVCPIKPRALKVWPLAAQYFLEVYFYFADFISFSNKTVSSRLTNPIYFTKRQISVLK